ncbi:MAG: hypothetical protein AAF960_03780 [Bacteroidota bacterium]
MSVHSNLTGKLSNVQLELIKLFATDVSNEELVELKKILLEFKFNRVTAMADELWEQKGWTEKDMDNLLKIHMRTAYKSQENYLRQ